MAYGIRVWAADGSLILDESDRISRFISSHSFAFPYSWTSMNITVPDCSTDGTWFAFASHTFKYTSSGADFSSGCRVVIGSGQVTVILPNSSSASYGYSNGGTLYVFRC